MTPTETLNQVTQLAVAMVGLSLANDQNFATTQGDVSGRFEITVNNADRLTAALKNVSYPVIYGELEQARCFNLKLLDGALITLRYRFLNGSIYEHSLAYFPSPDLEAFQSEPDLYLLDEIYADIISRNVVPFPVRFDFCADPTKFVEVHHPYSHLTLGQFQNCRIPVCSPVSPLMFAGFILRNFYNTAFRKYSDELPVSGLLFDNTITARERGIPHLELCRTP